MVLTLGFDTHLSSAETFREDCKFLKIFLLIKKTFVGPLKVISTAEKQGTTMAYVGRLNSNTTEDDLRPHLHDFADVVKLRNRCHGVESSFCVSLNNLDSAEKIFRHSIW